MSSYAWDSSVLVAYIDDRDSLHRSAESLQEALRDVNAEPVLFDLVYAESLSVLARRARERRGRQSLQSIAERLDNLTGLTDIVWLSRRWETDFWAARSIVIDSDGEVNMNDALIALACRESGLRYLASFDRDFDRFPWLTRVATPEQAARLPSS